MDPFPTPPVDPRLRRRRPLHADGDNDDMFYSCADCGCSYCLSDLDGDDGAGRSPTLQSRRDNAGKRLPPR